MSRSFKKSPAWTEQSTPNAIWAKRQAAKTVRRFTADISNGKWYRKLYCPWNICDYRFYQTKQQAIQEWETSRWPSDLAKTRAEIINEWAKMYKRK
ncbi:hypothetical protein PghCCS26_50720 [Paenibacillus glycanilyticus]|uniref:Uncharacterized protein n=1 Tax=Paenibacillus glycanilyticus TaxID=126569 RepID=A0ABQ6NUX0_9BACL|nr:hypothetical protein [Paenibacillus glycanilyticus]GMK47942.1 hypothetical protein PghCCS26_50720 [Paenibacillus glycanilyticus]